jgi:hypothetical protein
MNRDNPFRTRILEVERSCEPPQGATSNGGDIPMANSSPHVPCDRAAAPAAEPPPTEGPHVPCDRAAAPAAEPPPTEGRRPARPTPSRFGSGSRAAQAEDHGHVDAARTQSVLSPLDGSVDNNHHVAGKDMCVGSVGDHGQGRESHSRDVAVETMSLGSPSREHGSLDDAMPDALDDVTSGHRGAKPQTLPEASRDCLVPLSRTQAAAAPDLGGQGSDAFSTQNGGLGFNTRPGTCGQPNSLWFVRATETTCDGAISDSQPCLAAHAGPSALNGGPTAPLYGTSDPAAGRGATSRGGGPDGAEHREDHGRVATQVTNIS